MGGATSQVDVMDMQISLQRNDVKQTLKQDVGGFGGGVPGGPVGPGGGFPGGPVGPGGGLPGGPGGGGSIGGISLQQLNIIFKGIKLQVR